MVSTGMFRYHDIFPDYDIATILYKIKQNKLSLCCNAAAKNQRKHNTPAISQRNNTQKSRSRYIHSSSKQL